METATDHVLAGVPVGHLPISVSALVVRPTLSARLPAALEIRSLLTLPHRRRPGPPSPPAAC